MVVTAPLSDDSVAGGLRVCLFPRLCTLCVHVVSVRYAVGREVFIQVMHL